ncbi:UDP-N-acetylmuramoyl-tripeptide--D-alanyl-D-alanine ligase [Neobacillus niacini]|uniref:Mur ligase family protein n=1 Tax=Neobacillus niacini TaxID=86668 RepID=UPI0007ABA0D9|nr:UDP-N-acetylmuramoyl-tripeptide--D-alanyl-D-alanine ligase [Neobacillus niacini]MEC1524053.1 UDP-N-acetylmuramoyl-tripeptide--D-alanyl-D-alanine ligase [Neobacillus niacini]
MKAFSIFEIRLIINGELLQGSDDLLVDYIPYYQNINRRKRNVLIFIRNKSDLDLGYIKTRLPCAIVIDNDFDGLKSIEELTVIKVKNVKRAFWNFVQFYRGLFTIPVIAVTGTCGKTTTKEMIAHILREEKKKVQATKSSANSRLAHLHYLLGINEDTDAAVIETAVGKPGDILYASRFFKPTIGIITNIGACHLNACKTIDAYVAAKGEMVSCLDDSGVLILNADDEKTKTISLEHFKGKIVYFGIKNHADFYATDIQYGNGGMNFNLKLKEISLPVFVPGYGEHQVANALAAFAAINELGIDVTQAAKRLHSFKNLGRHLEITKGYNGATIIDDTWNFNTTSLEAAMQVLNYAAEGKHRIALFTDMAALGDYSLQLHKEAGEIVKKYGVDTIITIGNRSKEMAHYTHDLGLKCTIHSLHEYEQVYSLLKEILNKNSTLLIKSFGNNTSMIELASFFKR